MKKLIIITALLFATITTYAQSSASANVNIIISEVFEIKVNPAQTNIDIPINTVDHLTNGNNSNNLNHLSVTASNGYQVEAKAQTLITGSGGTIAIDKLEITVSDNGGGAIISDLPMSLSDQVIIDGSTGVLSRNLDVNYKIVGGEYLTQLEAGTYSTTIIYTLTLN